jgi:hypothetical protein
MSGLVGVYNPGLAIWIGLSTVETGLGVGIKGIYIIGSIVYLIIAFCIPKMVQTLSFMEF